MGELVSPAMYAAYVRIGAEWAGAAPRCSPVLPRTDPRMAMHCAQIILASEALDDRAAT